MSTFRKLLLKLLKPLVHHLERVVYRLQSADWKPNLDDKTREVLNGGCYSIDGKEAAMVSAIYGERMEPPQRGATVRVVVESRNGWDEYRLKATLIRPHGLDYETRGSLTVVSVKKPETLKTAGAVVILSAQQFANSVQLWQEEREPIPLPAKIKQAR
jgi:hypothetical protein